MPDTESDRGSDTKSGVGALGYAELHCHSNFSFLDGTSDPEALVERAIELGLSAIALTDSHGLYGVVRFAAAAKARALRGEPSIQVILGAELLLEGDERIVLLVQNLTGYRNLCWLIDRAHRQTLAPDDIRQLPLTPCEPLTPRPGGEGHPHIPLHLLADRTEGLIALVRPASAFEDALAERLAEYQRYILDEDLYVEINRHLVPGEERHNARLRRAAEARGLKTVAANAVHYATRDRALLHDVVTAIRLRVPLEQAAQPAGAEPPLLFPNDERCLKGPDEMAHLFRGHTEELTRTVEIARRCAFTLADLHYEFPLPDNLPPGRDPYDILVEEVWQGARCYYPRITRDVHDRIVQELEIVQLLNLPGYLLVFKDIVDFCRRERILVSIRGSAPASVLLYCLGLCPIDPLEHGLLFERFASPERKEYPDIDLDIAHEDRERVIQYVYETYGRARVSMVCEVNTYRARSAIRDVAFAMGLPQHQIDVLAKTVDLYDRRSLDTLLETGGSGLPVDGRTATLLISLCQQLVNAPRHLSIHVGGMVISARSLHEVVHNQPARMPGRTIIPWDKDDIVLLAELFEVHLIKLDLLGLGMLKVISRVFEQLEARGEEPLRLHGFRYDERVYDSICKGDTIGLFQIESRAQISFLPRLEPRTLSDVAISVGAIRPGPGATGAGGRIARRRRGLEPITYPHPELQPVLEQTSGVLLWQEQAMQVAQIMAGYTLGEAEQFRRAMTHKRSYEAMEALCEDMVQRMLKLGRSQALAEEIRRMVIGFAGYGFPRAHAYPFAHLALVSATLKLNYPAEYLGALLNSQPMGFYAPHTLIWDASRHGVRVLPVDVNASGWECALEDVPPTPDQEPRTPRPAARREYRLRRHPLPHAGRGVRGEVTSLRLGFNMVRGLGPHAREALERERARGPYQSIADFVRRTGLGRDAVERLAEVGAFLRFDERRAAIWQAGELAGLSSPQHLPGLADQLAERADLPPMGAWEATRADYGGLGLSVDRHLVSFYRPRLRLHNVRTAAELEHRRGGPVRIGGIVICRQRPETANDFMFMTLEDETGLVNVIVQPQVYHALTRALRGEPLLIIEGILQREGIVMDVIVRKAWPFSVLEGGTDSDTGGPDGRPAPSVPSHDFR
ncbi:MAG: error-prone DNA polymerase [Chloroflexi bacterium]|nr:error-prone DNA polymerase [Chloroflexota bacterium]